jgi:hypothetical protein
MTSPMTSSMGAGNVIYGRRRTADTSVVNGQLSAGRTKADDAPPLAPPYEGGRRQSMDCLNRDRGGNDALSNPASPQTARVAFHSRRSCQPDSPPS